MDEIAFQVSPETYEEICATLFTSVSASSASRVIAKYQRGTFYLTETESLWLLNTLRIAEARVRLTQNQPVARSVALAADRLATMIRDKFPCLLPSAGKGLSS